MQGSFPEGFEPMLAKTADMAKLKFPMIVSQKIDGYRCLVLNGVAYSRNLKPIPNLHVQKKIAELNGLLDGHDGELIVGPIAAPDVFRVTSSGVSRVDGEPDFRLYAFDRFDPELKNMPYSERVELVNKEYALPYFHVKNIDELYDKEEEFTSQGYEGLMIRSLSGPYKYGRSGVKEGYLLKLKRFLDSEYKIIGFEERMHNANEATKDNLGHTKRSSHKANMIPMDTLGALVCELEDGQVFNVGTGFSDELRSEIWANRDLYLGRLAKVKYTDIGGKNLPRFPVYLGIREESDL